MKTIFFGAETVVPSHWTYVIWERSVYVGLVPDYPPVQRQGVYLETRGQSATLKTTFSLIAAPAPGK